MAGRDMYFWMGGAVAALAANSADSLPLGMAAAAAVGAIWALGRVVWVVATAAAEGFAEGFAETWLDKRGDS